MQRAWQTPHGARPNREGAWFRLGACRLGALAPPGRSLEPRSNAWPRGMAVLRYVGWSQLSGSRLSFPCRQNSAYRSGCHAIFLGSFDFAQDFGSGLPLRSCPANRRNLQVRLPRYFLGSFDFAQDFGSGLPLRSCPLIAATPPTKVVY